jgi:CRP-like cAMP-binding protein
LAENDLSQLSSNPIFGGLGASELHALAEEAATVELRPNETLFSQGETSDAFFVVLQGKINIFVKGSNGSDQRLATLEPGHILGETSLLLKGTHSVTARSEGASRLLRFSNAQFQQLLDSNSIPALRVVRNLARVLAMRLREADGHIAEMCKDDSPSTVAEDDLDRLRRIFFSDWALSPGG